MRSKLCFTKRTRIRTRPRIDSDSDSEDDGARSPAYHDDLEIEIPDANPARGNLNVSNAHSNAATRSPSAGPISLASAANTPQRARNAPEEIDFGSLGDGDEDEDAEGEEEEEEEGLGARKSGAANTGRGGGGAEVEVEVDEDDPLYMEMMEGLAGGESSEESEEE